MSGWDHRQGNGSGKRSHNFQPHGKRPRRQEQHGDREPSDFRRNGGRYDRGNHAPAPQPHGAHEKPYYQERHYGPDQQQHWARSLKGSRDWREIIYRGVESDVLDYKAAMNWNLMNHAQRAKFARHCIAFANTKGGNIVVGVGENNAGSPALYTGLTPEQADSFDPSPVGNALSHYVDPPIDFTIERPVVDGRSYAIFVIRPFNELPHVATQSVEHELQQGVFYIRTASASSRPAANANELHQLLLRALNRQREMLGQMLRNLLSCAPQGEYAQDRNTLKLEYNESRQWADHRFAPEFSAKTPVFDLAIYPERMPQHPYPVAVIRDALFSTAGTMGFLNAETVKACYATNVSMRAASPDHRQFCQFFRSGQLHFRAPLPQAVQPELEEGIRGALEVAQLYYQALQWDPQDKLTLRLEISNSEDLPLLPSPAAADGPRCQIPEIICEFSFSGVLSAEDAKACCDKILKEFFTRFNA